MSVTYLNYPIFRQCLWHSKSSNFVKFSVNVCDISGQLYHPIFWQCVWQIRQTVSLYHSSFWQCPWHIRSTTFSNFLTMCVTYQDNLIIQFSDKVCDKSGKLCHCIIPVSDNVRDISGQLPCQMFWIFVWHIRKTVSLYHPIFRWCLWHMRPTTNTAMEKKESEKIETQAVAEIGQAQVEDQVVVEGRSRSCWWSWSSTTSPFGKIQ